METSAIVQRLEIANTILSSTMGNAQFRDDCTGQTCKGPISPPKQKQDNIVTSVREGEDAPPPSRTSRGKYVLKTIKTTLKDIFDPPEPERLPPKRHAPKHMIYGCNSADEHFACVDEICGKVANLHGKEGLDVMGFDFRVVHHPESCNCVGVEREEDDLTDSEADPDEMKEGYMESSEGEDDEYGQFDEESEGEAESFLVPLGTPLKIPEDKLSDTSQFPNNSTSNFHLQTSPYTSAAVSRNTSVVSLFSLATHNTDFSNPTADSSSRRRGGGTRNSRFPLSTIASAANIFVMEQDSCALRLHHTSSNTMITAENHSKFLADGKFYDELARVCMEYAQKVMMEEADLEWVTVSDEPTKSYGAIVSKDFLERRQTAKDNKAKHKTLLVVTGKGEVTAGVFSRRHSLVTSMDAGTALPFIREARQRDMDIVMLDPNALGYRNGMDVVERSLEHFFLDQSSLDENEEVYILAHSMAGAQIVRFFINSASCHSRPPTPASEVSSVSNATSNDSNGNSNSGTSATDNNNVGDQKLQRLHLLQRIRAFAFTDSNHNINWVKNHPVLSQALTGPPSLYIKSHKVHEKAKELGETHHDCQFWRHRFGDIKTLWAGTHEHALTNYTARAHIWEHFDMFLREGPSEEGQSSVVTGLQ